MSRRQKYIRDNKGRLASDAFTVIGLGYLTYQSGLYTLEAMKDLADKKEGEEEVPTSLRSFSMKRVLALFVLMSTAVQAQD